MNTGARTEDHQTNGPGHIAGIAVERTGTDEALRALTDKLIQAQEEERRRLVRELPVQIRVPVKSRSYIKLRGSNHAKTKSAAGG